MEEILELQGPIHLPPVYYMYYVLVHSGTCYNIDHVGGHTKYKYIWQPYIIAHTTSA